MDIIVHILRPSSTGRPFFKEYCRHQHRRTFCFYFAPLWVIRERPSVPQKRHTREERQKGVFCVYCFWRDLKAFGEFVFSTIFFFKLASQGGELWAFISEWKACGWHPEQRGLSARPRQTSVPGLYSKILEQRERAVVGRGWVKEGGRKMEGSRKREGGSGGVWECMFFFL